MQKLLDLRVSLAHSESNLTAIQQKICIAIGRCCHFRFLWGKNYCGLLLTYTDRPYSLYAWHSDYNKHGKCVIIAIVVPNIFLMSIYTLLCYIFLRILLCLFKRCFAPAFCANCSVELFFVFYDKSSVFTFGSGKWLWYRNVNQNLVAAKQMKWNRSNCCTESWCAWLLAA